MNNIIKIGDILVFPSINQVYRIIYISDLLIACCKIESGKLDIRKYPTLNVIDQIAAGQILVEKKENHVIEVDKLDAEERELFERNQTITRELEVLYGPTYENLASSKRKPELREIEIRFNIKREALRRLYVRYIQSGLDETSLLDKRSKHAGNHNKSDYQYINGRPGRSSDSVFSSKVVITNEIRKQFDEAIEERKSGRCKTYDSAYSWLVNKYYSETFIDNGMLVVQQKNEAKIPSKRQFTYYARKKVSKQELDIVKTSMQEVRNDKRLLLGDTYSDALGPGDLVEIDALEVDVSLVSEADNKQSIGRPILYLMIDVFSRMILAMSVSLHNNAMIALTNLFLNLSDNKYEFCLKYGHEINDNAWISNIIPRRIRVDRGSDFKSNQFAEICKVLGIDRQLVSGATGSLKGNIEQEFRTLHAAQKAHLDGRGVITKRYDSKHHEQAVLTIEEYTKMAVDFVLHHNVRAASEYPLTADMIKNNVHAFPSELWAYGCDKYGAPRPITNIDMYRYSLMMPAKASLDRSGITFKELSYLNSNDPHLFARMYELHNKREKMDIRIDPRNITNIYYLRDGMLMVASLNPLKMQNDGFAGMTLFEYESFLKEKRRIRKEDAARTQRTKNSLHSAQDAIVQEAVSYKTKEPAKVKNIREARNLEKQNVARQNSIASRMDVTTHMEKSTDVNVIEQSEQLSAVKEQRDKTISAHSPESVDFSGLGGFKAAMKTFEEGEY